MFDVFFPAITSTSFSRFFFRTCSDIIYSLQSRLRGTIRVSVRREYRHVFLTIAVKISVSDMCTDSRAFCHPLAIDLTKWQRFFQITTCLCWGKKKEEYNWLKKVKFKCRGSCFNRRLTYLFIWLLTALLSPHQTRQTRGSNLTVSLCFSSHTTRGRRAAAGSGSVGETCVLWRHWFYKRLRSMVTR